MTSNALRIIPLVSSAPLPASVKQRGLAVGIYAITIGRLIFAVISIGLILSDRGLLAVLSIVVFVVIDVYDGEVARRHGLENGTRRFLDGAVDKVSIHAVAAVVCLTIDGAVLFWVALIVRDLMQAAIGSWILWRRRVIAAGAKWHRSYTLAIAVWGAWMILFQQVFTLLAVATLLLGIATLVDYARQCVQYDRGTWRGGLAGLEIEK